jgi:acetyl-CoA carboxylase carboxyltransferase component
LKKYTESEVRGLPTVDELRNSLMQNSSSNARDKITCLFDQNTFVEIGAYTKRGFSDFFTTDKANEFEGVICGYGAVYGKLVFAFLEDSSRMGGVIDERHAKKIADLYKLAISNGAPVIGFFDSNGTDIFQGTAGLAAYGRIMSCVSSASGKIPQLAYVSGKCIGTASAIASMFDFIIKEDEAELYVSSPSLTGTADAQNNTVAYTGNPEQCINFAKTLISFLPDNSSQGIIAEQCSDKLNKKLGELDFAGEGLIAISAISDNGVFYEIGHDYEEGVVTAFSTIAGIKCGVVANSYRINEGRITSAIARKISKFVNFCDAFSLPVVTLVDSLGLQINKENELNYFAPELARLAFAYSSLKVPAVTVILGHAIGASFVLLGSKSLGADIVYCLDNAEIGALSADSGVAFAWDSYITLEETRESLVEKWKATVSSPANASASGETDDIISTSELRARICSALLMLCSKGSFDGARRKVLPL